MASYNELLALIDAYINQNGVQAITGQVLNGVLRAMVDQLGRGYSIMGAADPTTDPGTPDGPETWFASVPGTYTNFDGIQIVDGELALLSYVPSTGFSKNTIYEGFQTVQATIDGNVGTPAVGVTYQNGVLSFDFRNMKGATGDPAGFGSVSASVDGNVGTPGVSVQTSGPDTEKNIVFNFTNLKGETGVTSVLATVDNTSGNPQCAVSLNGQQLVLNFTGLKGAQGDTGSSVDYPFTIVNNLTTDDATQALSAAMGVELAGQVSQLEQKVNGLTMTASGSKTGSGWLSIELPNTLETGKKYTLVFTKNVNMSGVTVSTSTSSSSSDRVDIGIVTLDYFAQNTTTLSGFTPSGDAKFLLFWCGGSMEIGVTVTGEGLSDTVEKNKTDIATLNGDVATLDELIPALGKGEMETLSPNTNSGRINNSGEIVAETGSYYTDPIPVSKGDVILLSGFVSAVTSPISETDSAGSFYKPLIGVGKGLSTYAYYVIEDGFVALSYSTSASYPNVSFQKTSLSSLASLADGITSLQEQIDELTGTKDYSATFPEYVFGIESGSFAGREYATMIYPESIINKPGTPEEGHPPVKSIPKGLLNGTIRMALQKPKQDTYAFNNFRTKTETIAKTAIIGGPGLLNKTFNFDYIRANRYNGQNKKMFLLVVGASITQQGGYVGQIDRLGDMDNTDIGGINVKSLGSNVGTVTPTITYEYGGQTKTITTHTEGRAGWTTYGLANWPFEGRMDGAVDTLGGEGMWYASGMATRTPYDSNTPGQAFEPWTGNGTQRCALFSAVFGRYKPDYCEELWIALHNFHTIFRSGAHTMWYYSTGAEYVSGATVPTYNGATSNALMEQFFDEICYNPDNVFYDRDRAREYTGSYVWTHKTAFSIEKWVERYRTLDDNGNQLTLGNGTGTFVTESNINNPVCTPTFVLCGMGANDYVGMYYDDWAYVSGTSEAIKTGILSLLDDLHEQRPTAHLGYCVPRQSGVFFPELWFNVGIIGQMGFYSPNRSELNTLMMGEMPELDVDNDYNYVPLYFTSSPVSGQSPHYVGDFDNQNGDKLVVSGQDLGHVGTEWEISVAYQILAWMYWCLQ